MEGLSINESSITNEDIMVTYTPSSSVKNYSYIVEKDGVEQAPVDIYSNTPTVIVLSETGNYKLIIKNYDYYSNETIQSSGIYKIDKSAPKINIAQKTYKIKVGDSLDYMKGVTASDIEDGDLTNSINTNIHSLDLSKTGIKTLEYTVSDNAGNTVKEVAYITVLENNTNLIRLGQISILLALVVLVLLIKKYLKSIIYEKRFSKYTINLSSKSISLLDSLSAQYNDFISKFSNHLNDFELIKKRSKKYEKYVGIDNNIKYDPISFVARKIVVGIIFIVVAIVFKLLRSSFLSFYEMILPFIIGFYTLDVIYEIKYRKYRKKIQNDMLEAITIMNNAFKSGRSIIQSIDLVASELEGPISMEFKRISMEVSLGLDIEVAFKRFSKRINLKEAVYLTSSLSVLNKTGGNIIKVFDSIEKNLINKKKLNEELKSLTSSSKFITYVLILMPIIFVIFISIINQEYFLPLFSNPIGILLILIMLLIYTIYIYVVTRIMKVRM